MRQERDSLGEIELPAEALYGAATARLLKALPVADRSFPRAIARALVCIREAQATAFRLSGQWPEAVCVAVCRAAQRLRGDDRLLDELLCYSGRYGGGVRGIHEHVNELLANLALESLGAAHGDYHLVAPLFHLELEAELQSCYMTAVHIAYLDGLRALRAATAALAATLRERAADGRNLRYLARQHYRDAAVAELAEFFLQYAETIERNDRQLDWLQAQLLPCWRGRAEALLPLRQLVGQELAVCHNSVAFPGAVDLHLSLSGQLKALALVVLQLCEALGEFAGGRGFFIAPRLRPGHPFNPTETDLLIPETVAQTMFLILGNDAAVAAAIGAGGGSAGTYAPFYTAQLLTGIAWLQESLQLLTTGYLEPLRYDPEAMEKSLALTSMQAQRLIPVLGYERAVQVARIAALTEKPVRTVVVKMKLLPEATAAQIFDQAASEAGEEE